MEIPVELSKIIINEEIDQQVIFLRELNGDRSFPIVIGISEILAIDRRIKGIRLPRPMTHDLLAKAIESLGGVVEKVVINDMDNHTFYAMLHVRSNGKVIQIDSRPSDALALISGLESIPVYVDHQVFEKMQK
jgi:bifunctional DNase/RNase